MENPETSAQTRSERSAEAPAIPEGTRNVGVGIAAAREIRNVGMLDLTGLESPESLDGVETIRNVGVDHRAGAAAAAPQQDPDAQRRHDDPGPAGRPPSDLLRRHRPQRRRPEQPRWRPGRRLDRLRHARHHLARDEGRLRPVHRLRRGHRAGRQRGGARRRTHPHVRGPLLLPVHRRRRRQRAGRLPGDARQRPGEPRPARRPTSCSSSARWLSPARWSGSATSTW